MEVANKCRRLPSLPKLRIVGVPPSIGAGPTPEADRSRLRSLGEFQVRVLNLSRRAIELIGGPARLRRRRTGERSEQRIAEAAAVGRHAVEERALVVEANWKNNGCVGLVFASGFEQRFQNRRGTVIGRPLSSTNCSALPCTTTRELAAEPMNGGGVSAKYKLVARFVRSRLDIDAHFASRERGLSLGLRQKGVHLPRTLREFCLLPN